MRKSSLLRYAFIRLVFGLSLFANSIALAAQPTYEETDELPTVQNRKYSLHHEIHVGIGTIPTDAFYKAVSFGGGYAWHLTHLWAVEGRFSYLQRFNSSLRDKLEKNFGEPPSKFAEVQFYAELGTLFKPLYGKLTFLNNQQVFGELYASAHVVIASLEGGSPTSAEPQGKGQRLGFGLAPGFGIRGFLNEYFSLRIDFRAPIIFSAGDVLYPISLTFNVAFTTRGGT